MRVFRRSPCRGRPAVLRDLRAVLAGVAALWLLGCGGAHPMGTSNPDGGDTAADMTPAPGTYQTPFPPSSLPVVVSNGGGILASPRVVPVFFGKDPLQSTVVSFLQGFVADSPAWQVLQDYGVGQGTVEQPVVLNQSLGTTVSDAMLQGLVVSGVQGGSLPASDPNTMYVLFIPSGTTVNQNGAMSCRDFGGYHDSVLLKDGTHAPYVVLPRCSSMTTLLTLGASHEIAESATDPLLNAYNTLGPPYALWAFALNGAEIGDLCENLGDPAFADPEGAVSRLWSNSAAQALKNPCQPAPPGPSFFAVPILTELKTVIINGLPRKVESVPIAAGASGTVEVRLLSDQPGVTFSVLAKEVPLPTQTGAMAAPVLSLSFQERPAQGQDGATLHLQISVRAGTAAGYTTVLLTSTGPVANSTQKTQTQWVAAVRITG